jgi:hypothetical protein
VWSEYIEYLRKPPSSRLESHSSCGVYGRSYDTMEFNKVRTAASDGEI